MTPKVSIEMCTYNRAHYLPEAIQSVLAQAFKDWELIILDDASTDNTEAVVTPYLSDTRIRYMKHPANIGLGKNRVAGIEQARGVYIAILDSDDRWNDPRKLELQNNFLDAHPECGVIGTFANVIDEKGEVLKKLSFETTDKKIRSKMLLRDQIMNSSSLFRKSALEKVGTYNASLAPAEDYDLFLRLGMHYEFANLPEYMLDYRIHSSNSSGAQKTKHAKIHLQLVKKYKGKYAHYFLALLKGYARVLKNSLHL